MALAPAVVAVIAVLIVQSTRPATSYPPPSHPEEPECQTDACRRALAGLPPLDDSEAGAQAAAPSTPRAPAPTAPSVPRIVSPIVVNETTTASDASTATLAGEAAPVPGLAEAGASSTLVIIVGQDAGAGVAILQGALAGDASVIAWSTRPPEPPPPRVPCGAITCNPGMVCCNSSCGYCTEPGASCSKVLCNAPVSPVSIPCGPNTCNSGQTCCNFSCGICTPPGGTCSQTQCNIIEYPFSTPCGLNTCNSGKVCCNPSCGTCTDPGETCSWELCP